MYNCAGGKFTRPQMDVLVYVNDETQPVYICLKQTNEIHKTRQVFLFKKKKNGTFVISLLGTISSRLKQV